MERTKERTRSLRSDHRDIARGHASRGMYRIALTFLIACTSSPGGTPLAVDAPSSDAHSDGPPSHDVDAHVVDAVVEGDAARDLPHVIVPSELGGVRDFAYTDNDIYPIVNIAGNLQLVRCPISGCSTSPQVIGAAQNGRGVVVSGAAVYWLGSHKVIMRANLDGSGATARYEYFDGEIEPPLRAADGVIYFNYHPTDFHTVTMKMTAIGMTSPQALAGTQLTANGFSQQLDVQTGKLVYWHDTQGIDPQPIEVHDLATGTNTQIATSVDMSELVLASHGVAWVEATTNHADVRACLFGTTCNTPQPGPPAFVALAAYGDHLYFSGRAAGNLPTIVTCTVQDVAAATCQPQPIAYPAGALDLLNTRVAKADAHAVYVGTDPQGAGSLWRIDL